MPFDEIKRTIYSNSFKLLRDFSLLLFNAFILSVILGNYSSLISIQPPISFVCVWGVLITTILISFETIKIIVNRILLIKYSIKVFRYYKKLDDNCSFNKFQTLMIEWLVEYQIKQIFFCFFYILFQFFFILNKNVVIIQLFCCIMLLGKRDPFYRYSLKKT